MLVARGLIRILNSFFIRHIHVPHIDRCVKNALVTGPLTKYPSDQVKAGTVNVKFIDATVKNLLRTKFALGLFESEHS